jgi:hypothetical protein
LTAVPDASRSQAVPRLDHGWRHAARQRDLAVPAAKLEVNEESLEARLMGREHPRLGLQPLDQS